MSNQDNSSRRSSAQNRTDKWATDMKNMGYNVTEYGRSCRLEEEEEWENDLRYESYQNGGGTGSREVFNNMNAHQRPRPQVPRFEDENTSYTGEQNPQTTYDTEGMAPSFL